MHPLDGAYKRVKRAEEHLADLDIQINILSQEMKESIVTNSQPSPFPVPEGYKRETIETFKIKIPKVPDIVGILIGEIVYNLRSALDYLVYELARLDSGTIQQRTQFSIEDTKDIFWGRHLCNLKGLSDKHIAVIELLQPYSGCNWTKLIRDLSDPDKHRKLTIITNIARFNINVIDPSTKSNTVNQPMNMDNSASFQIKFRAGTSIVDIDTLKKLKFYVTETLDSFNPDFK